MKLLLFAPALALLSWSVPAPAPESSAAEKYAIDSSHSSVVFKIQRGVAPFYGRFDRVSGFVNFDSANPAASTGELTIEADSVYSGNERRDNHLKSPDFFDVEQFDKIRFTITSAEPDEETENLYEVEGELDLHGVQKFVKAAVLFGGEGEGRGGSKTAGFEVTLKIKRSDFDMKYAQGGLGDEVTIMLGIAAQQGGGGGLGRRR